MADKKTLGRQKIPMAKIEKENDRYSTFSKRRSGLYKKASELIEQYDVDMGIIMFSPTGKPFSFFHPTVNAVIDSFLSPHTQPSESTRLDAANIRDKVKELKAKLDEFGIAKDDEYNQISLPDHKKWWKSIKELDAKEVKNFLIWLESTISGLKNCLMLLEKGASSSAQAPPEDAN